MENTTNQPNNLSEKENNNYLKAKPMLTPQSLGEMIIKYIDDKKDDIQHNTRLFLAKRNLLNYLFRGIGKKSKDDLAKDTLSNPLKEDDNLILYTFYLSQNKQFNFEWSYLLSKYEKIEKFIKTFNGYINYICIDINNLIKLLSFEGEIEFQIDGYLTIHYKPNSTIEAQIELDKLNKLLCCKDNYYSLKILFGTKTIISLNRSTKETIEAAIDKIETLMTVSFDTQNANQNNE